MKSELIDSYSMAYERLLVMI